MRLSEEVMSSQMVLGQSNEFWVWNTAFAGEDLRMYIITELLDTNFVEPRGCGDFRAVSVGWSDPGASLIRSQ